MEPVNILCGDCPAETARWTREGYTVLGCDKHPTRKGICQLKLTRAQSSAPAALSAPPLALVRHADIEVTTAASNRSAPTPINDAAVVADIAWGKKVPPAFKERVIALADWLGVQADHLMACIAFESAESFSASIKNPVSGATGLIQFMPPTAKNLGTSVALLEQMSATEQLDYVQAYFAPWKGRLKTLGDLYMAILWPLAIGKSDDFVLFKHGSVAYEQNKGLDADGDGNVTRTNACAPVQRKLELGLSRWKG